MPQRQCQRIHPSAHPTSKPPQVEPSTNPAKAIGIQETWRVAGPNQARVLFPTAALAAEPKPGPPLRITGYGSESPKTANLASRRESRYGSTKLAMPKPLQPKVAVSYSWKEERSGTNAKAVDAFCKQLESRDVAVIRDTARLKHGESIKTFMRSVGASDFLCVFLSDAYLRSPNCMYELLIAWQRSKDNPDEFRQRVKVWVMPGAESIRDLTSRLQYLKHWLSEKERVEPLIKEYSTQGLAPGTLDEFTRIKEIGGNVDAILQFCAGHLSPGSAEEFQAWIATQLPEAPAKSGEASLDVARSIRSGVASLGPKDTTVHPEADPLPPTDREWTNSLGMKFVPVSGLNVRFCIWPTRVQDYEVFAKAVPDTEDWWNKPQGRSIIAMLGPTYPVERISWHRAMKFCQWLTQSERRAGVLTDRQLYRLPKDLEWSAAVGLTAEIGPTPKARSGKVPEVYPWGAQWPPPDFSGNFADETTRLELPLEQVIEGYHDGYATTSPVGKFNASVSGLFDLSGNVWEWCEDWYDDMKECRVLRGGAWNVHDPKRLLSSYRHSIRPAQRIESNGFRVVLLVDGSAR